ncbi:28096_t:CDS:1 [Dentiscutata erythropus]|uniref:28096_t:CDS:1 n=1 Tax=Dentiscutata erythropus TaxID=1348616 RepID=A0A9N9INU0_9GLOM|nr:28096_t:CDS:1 [Dentiscutata erythropus]
MQYRSVCEQVQQDAPKVLFSYSEQKSLDYRTIATSVKKMEALDKPSLNTNTQSSKQSNLRESDDNSDFSFVANGTLVSHLTSSPCRSPGYNFTKLNYLQSSEIEQENRTLESLYSAFIRNAYQTRVFKKEISIYSLRHMIQKYQKWFSQILECGVIGVNNGTKIPLLAIW